jgi:ABC-type phosphate/phosphonate transport system substrate-binding protein
MQRDRRTFLKQALSFTGAGLGVQLLAACSPSFVASPAQSAAPSLADAVTTVRCGFASVNPSNLVPIVGQEKPDLPGPFGIAFDLLTMTNSPNALTALVGGSLDIAVVTPDADMAAQDKEPDIRQLIAVGNGTVGLRIDRTAGNRESGRPAWDDCGSFGTARLG